MSVISSPHSISRNVTSAAIGACTTLPDPVRYNGKMMRLAWATDVHLNFVSGPQIAAFAQALVAGEPDAVVLSGDIAEAPTLREHLLAVEAVVQRPLYFVLGNHDYYGGS